MYPVDSEVQNIKSEKVVSEQLRLFTLDDLEAPESNGHQDAQDDVTTREKLAQLLSGDLEFHGADTSYASHDFHAFAAKFPPQLPRAFILGLTTHTELVVDPMMGSGTAIVEAMLEGRRAIGLDIDPLALRLSTVKTTPIEVNLLRDIGHRVITAANKLVLDEGLLDCELAQRFDQRTKAFIDYWFLPRTQHELLALVLHIEEISDMAVRRFLELTFSAIIVTKSGGVSRARDLAHSRPHLDKSKVPKSALEQFVSRFRRNLNSMALLPRNGNIAVPIAGDARAMPLADESVNLIVTSPPYANALDYMRAHKFSLVWFGKAVDELSQLRATYIGSERIGHLRYGSLPFRVQNIVAQLAELDRSKAAVLHKYFVEMKQVIVEMFRVLSKGSAAVIVVGTSTMRGLDVETHLCLADIAAEIGFDVVAVAKRNLERNKRMMPARFGKKGDSMIEQRMHDEYVIGLLKPHARSGMLNANT